MTIMGRNSGEKTLKEAITLSLESLRLKDKYLENVVAVRWEELVGRMIASRTSEIYVSNKKLYLRLSSAPLKQELIQGKQRIIDLVNENMEEMVISEVIFL